MDIERLWDQARRRTEILRMRLQDLASFEATSVPYTFLAESALNAGDTVVRRGRVLIERPAIVLPNLSPQFEGFAFDTDLRLSDDAVATLLLVRGIRFPSLKYRHELSSLDVYEGSVGSAARHFLKQLAAAEDTTTGLVVGPEEAWQLSILLLVGAMVVRSAEGDLRRILEAWRKRQEGHG
jgi:hypothetical protein